MQNAQTCAICLSKRHAESRGPPALDRMEVVLMPLPWINRINAALLLAGCCLVLAWMPSTALAETSCTPGADWGQLDRDAAARVLALVNDHRRSLGLGDLAASASLTHAAEWKSLHMGHYGYFDHDDPGPPVARTFAQRLTDCGADGNGFGENIAAGQPTPESVVSAWLASPGHRENIERPIYTASGIGVASVSGRLFWTEDFGAGTSDLASVATAGSSPTPATPPAGPAVARATKVSASDDRYALGCHRWFVLHVLANDAIAGGSARIIDLSASTRVRAHLGSDAETVIVKARSCSVRSARLSYRVTDGLGHTATATVTLHRHRSHTR